MGLRTLVASGAGDFTGEELAELMAEWEIEVRVPAIGGGGLVPSEGKPNACACFCRPSLAPNQRRIIARSN